MSRRKPSLEEQKLWRAAVQGVTPLKEWQETISPEPPQLPSQPTPSTAKPKPGIPAHVKSKRSSLPSNALSRSFDGESERRLKNGQLKIEARLDLHGMIEAVAHEAVMRFLSRSLAAERRMVLIITGKGSASGEGSLKRNLALWLEAAPQSIRARVHAIRVAEPQDGGGGAFYVLLKAV